MRALTRAHSSIARVCVRGAPILARAPRVLAALVPFVATCALLSFATGDAASAPKSVSAVLDAAREAAFEAGAPDAHSDGAPIAADAADAKPDAKPDVPVRPDALFADVARPDVLAREGGWFPDADRPIAPDPSPLLSDAVFVMTVTFAKGAITVDKVDREKLPSRQAVVRRFGRFAAELYSGPTLLERVRFDFPLIADDDYTGDVYARGLITSVKVRIPDSERPNKLEIWDRATDRRWSFDYPPKL
jgi:hypothetical protein